VLQTWLPKKFVALVVIVSQLCHNASTFSKIFQELKMRDTKKNPGWRAGVKGGGDNRSVVATAVRGSV